jgi:beta-galactosidase
MVTATLGGNVLSRAQRRPAAHARSDAARPVAARPAPAPATPAPATPVAGRSIRPERLGPFPIAGLTLDAWRAPTENDRFSLEETWRAAGLDRLLERTYEDGRARYGPAGLDSGFELTCRWSAIGEAARLDVEIERLGEWRLPLPRLGVALALRTPAPGDVRFEWLGLGPGESYPDSRAAGWHGRHSRTVREAQTPYVVPQENGNRSEVSWLRLSTAAGGLLINGDNPFEVAVRPWSTEQLERARHTDELVEGDLLWVHLAAGVTGLGSASCGPAVRPSAEFRAAHVRLGFTFEAA